MATDFPFQFLPTSGPLPGRSFESQTQAAINDLAALVAAGGGSSDEALELAREALAAANNALTAANNAASAAQAAQSTADTALATANTAITNAATALARANDAYDLASSATDAANNALANANLALTNAEEALTRANEAYDLAESLSTRITAVEEKVTQFADSLDEALGAYQRVEDEVDANTRYLDAESLYVVNTASTNLPVPPPLYLKCTHDTSHSIAKQVAWTDANELYTRVAQVEATLSDGEGEFPLEYDGDMGDALTNTLTATRTGGTTTLSLASTDGWTLVQTPSSGDVINCVLTVTNANAATTGTFTMGDQTVVGIAEGVAHIGDESADSSVAIAYILDVAHDSGTGELTLTFRVEWEYTTEEYSVSWGEWEALGGGSVSKDEILGAPTINAPESQINQLLYVNGRYYINNPSIENLPVPEVGVLEVIADTAKTNTFQQYVTESKSLFYRNSTSEIALGTGFQYFRITATSGATVHYETLVFQSSATTGLTLRPQIGGNFSVEESSAAGVVLTGKIDFYSNNTAFREDGFTLTIQTETGGSPQPGGVVVEFPAYGAGEPTVTEDTVTNTSAYIRYQSGEQLNAGGSEASIYISATWTDYTGTITWSPWVLSGTVEPVENLAAATSVTISATTPPNVVLTPAADITITIDDLGAAYSKVTSIKIVPTAAINITWVFTGADSIIWTNLESLSALASGELGLVNIHTIASDCIAAKILPA